MRVRVRASVNGLFVSENTEIGIESQTCYNIANDLISDEISAAS